MEKAKPYLVAVFLISVGLCCFLFPKLTGHEAINWKAYEVVNEALGSNAKAFLSVSGIKAVIAMMEGSTAGVVFVDVEIGDLLQPAYDFIDNIWTLLLYGLFVLSLYLVILETGLLSIGIQIMGVGFLAWGVYMLSSARQPDVQGWAQAFSVSEKYSLLTAKATLFVGILLAYLVPVTILASHYLTVHFTQPIKKKNYEEIAAIETRFDRIKEDFLAIKDEISVKRPVESISQARTNVRKIASVLTGSLNSTLHVFLYYAVLLFVEILVFPLLTAFVLYKFVSRVVTTFMGQVDLAVAQTRTRQSGGKESA